MPLTLEPAESTRRLGLGSVCDVDVSCLVLAAASCSARYCRQSIRVVSGTDATCAWRAGCTRTERTGCRSLRTSVVGGTRGRRTMALGAGSLCIRVGGTSAGSGLCRRDGPTRYGDPGSVLVLRKRDVTAGEPGMLGGWLEKGEQSVLWWRRCACGPIGRVWFAHGVGIRTTRLNVVDLHRVLWSVVSHHLWSSHHNLAQASWVVNVQVASIEHGHGRTLSTVGAIHGSVWRQ